MIVALDVYTDWLGIPDGPRPPDHYQLLRLVKFEDDLDKINKFYKKLRPRYSCADAKDRRFRCSSCHA